MKNHSFLLILLILTGCSEAPERNYNNPFDKLNRVSAAKPNQTQTSAVAPTKSETSTAVFDLTHEVKSELGDSESGDNKIISINYIPALKEFYIVKDVLKSKENGKEFRPLIQLTWDDNYYSKRQDFSQVDFFDWIPTSIFYTGTQLLSSGNFSDSPSEYSEWSMVSYGHDGEYVNGQSIVLDPANTNKPDAGVVTYFFYNSANQLMALAYRLIEGDYVSSVCEVNLKADGILQNCSTGSESNPAIAVTPRNAVKGIGVLGENIYLVALNSDDTYSIQMFNQNFIYQGSFYFDNLSVKVEDLENGLLTSDGDNLFFVSLSDNQLVFRRIKFSE